MTELIHSVLPQPPRPIVYVHPEDSIRKCVDLMSDLDIGALVVVDNNKKLVGIVSERDIVRSCLHPGVSIEKGRVADVVFKEVTILSPHDAVERAMQAMTKTKRRHVLVREEHQNDFIAIISIGDLLFNLLDNKEKIIEHLENYIHT